MTISKGKSVIWAKTLSRARGSHRSKLNVVIATLTSGVILTHLQGRTTKIPATGFRQYVYIPESRPQGTPNPAVWEYHPWVIPWRGFLEKLQPIENTSLRTVSLQSKRL